MEQGMKKLPEPYATAKGERLYDPPPFKNNFINTKKGV
jgi:hypothetical protein